jgi:hypothetical protein
MVRRISSPVIGLVTGVLGLPACWTGGVRSVRAGRRPRPGPVVPAVPLGAGPAEIRCQAEAGSETRRSRVTTSARPPTMAGCAPPPPTWLGSARCCWQAARPRGVAWCPSRGCAHRGPWTGTFVMPSSGLGRAVPSRWLVSQPILVRPTGARRCLAVSGDQRTDVVCQPRHRHRCRQAFVMARPAVVGDASRQRRALDAVGAVLAGLPAVAVGGRGVPGVAAGLTRGGSADRTGDGAPGQCGSRLRRYPSSTWCRRPR